MKENGVASSLRWRARVNNKGEAMSVPPFDDSAVVVDEIDGLMKQSSTGDHPKDRSSSIPDNKTILKLIWKAMKYERIKVLGLYLTAITLVTGSIWSLQVVHTFLVAIMATFNVSISFLSVYQHRALRQERTIRRIHNETRHKAHNLRLQNERLYRQFISLDTKCDRIKQIENELSKRIVSDGGPQDGQQGQQVNTNELVSTLQSYKRVHAEIQVQLQRQVEEEVMRSVLTSDQDHNWILESQELEKLIHKLSVLPGILNFQEQHFRAILVDDNTNTSTTENTENINNNNNKDASLVNVVRLLRQISNDVGVSQQQSLGGGGARSKSPRMSTTPPRKSTTRRSLLFPNNSTTTNASGGGDGATPYHYYKRSAMSSTVFEFNTQSMLQQQQPNNNNNKQQQKSEEEEEEGQRRQQPQQQPQQLLLLSPPQEDLHRSSKMAL